MTKEEVKIYVQKYTPTTFFRNVIEIRKEKGLINAIKGAWMIDKGVASISYKEGLEARREMHRQAINNITEIIYGK